MNFLLDENVSLGLAYVLREHGHVVTAVAESTDRGIEDTNVWKLARESSSILITRDYHFTNPTRFDPSSLPGIIYIRPGNLVLKFVVNYSIDQFLGKLVTLSRGGISVR